MAWAWTGNGLVLAFNEDVPTYITSGFVYQSTTIVSDPAQPGKLILIYENSNDNYVKLSKDFKKTVPEILNPNQLPPSEMSLNYGTNLLNRIQFPYGFGKYMYMSPATAGGALGAQLNYVEYNPNPAVANKKKTITKGSLSAGVNVIKATSPSYDCVVTVASAVDGTGPATAVDTILIGADAAGTTITNQFATVVTSGHVTAANAFTFTSANYAVGDACWALKVDENVYIKPATNVAWTRAPATAPAGALIGAKYDYSLKFAYNANKLYKFGTTDYAAIVNSVTGLKTNVFLTSSPDGNKVFIFSYQAGTAAGTYDIAMKLYVFDGTNWSAANLGSNIPSFTTGDGMATLIASPSLEFIGTGYNNGTSGSPSIVNFFVRVNFTSLTVTPFTTPA